MVVGDDNVVAAAHVLDAGGSLAFGVEHLGDARSGEQYLADFLADRGVEDDDVRDLMVDDGECLGVKGVESKAAVLGLEFEPIVRT